MIEFVYTNAKTEKALELRYREPLVGEKRSKTQNSNLIPEQTVRTLRKSK